jgi:hypothetical protein
LVVIGSDGFIIGFWGFWDLNDVFVWFFCGLGIGDVGGWMGLTVFVIVQ